MLGQRVAPAVREGAANALLDWRKEPRYDTFITAAAGAGVANVPFFTVPRGQIGSGFAVAKTENETNMAAANQIGSPNQFVLHGFALEAVLVNGAAAILPIADFLAIYFSGLFRFTLGANRVLLEVPVSRIPSGPGPQGFAASAVGGTPLAQGGITNGVPHISHFYDFKTFSGEGLLLDGTQSFRCDLIYGGAAGNLITAAITRIRCYLMGWYGAQL